MSNPELSRQERKEAERRVVRAVYEAGQFPELKPRQMRVAELYYLGEERLTLARVGSILEPPIKTREGVRLVKNKILEALRPTVLKAPAEPSGWDTLEFSPRTTNALKRAEGFIPTTEFLRQLSDEELLGLRNFGTKALRELRGKIPYVPPGDEKSKT